MRKYSIGDIVYFIYSTDSKETFKVVKAFYDKDVYEIVSLKNNRRAVAIGDELVLAKDKKYAIGIDDYYTKMFKFDQKQIESFNNLIKDLFFNTEPIEKEGEKVKKNRSELSIFDYNKEISTYELSKMKRSEAINLLLDALNDYNLLLNEFGDEEYKEKIDYVKELLAELTQEKT